MFAGMRNGKPVFIGSNNTVNQNGNLGPQKISVTAFPRDITITSIFHYVG
jgi:hypothetical protein